MPSEKEIMVVIKAVVYDLTQIFDDVPDKEKTYTAEEIKAILNTYVKGAEK